MSWVATFRNTQEKGRFFEKSKLSVKNFMQFVLFSNKKLILFLKYGNMMF